MTILACKLIENNASFVGGGIIFNKVFVERSTSVEQNQPDIHFGSMNLYHQDIVTAIEECIFQQCNCLTVRAHGLSETLAQHFPHGNLYGQRNPICRRNVAIPEHRSIP
jgi:hypothetical protein